MTARSTSSPPEWTSLCASIIPPPRRLDLIEETLDREAVLVDPVSGNTHQLNASALAVLRLCDGKRTTRGMAAKLTEHYDLAFNQALEYVDQFIALLLSLGLLGCSDGLTGSRPDRLAP